MSTRCTVIHQRRDKRVSKTYIHCDGYPTGVGKTLAEHYANVMRVRELINLGDISSLGSSLLSRAQKDAHGPLTAIDQDGDSFDGTIAHYRDWDRLSGLEIDCWWNPSHDSMRQALKDTPGDIEFVYLGIEDKDTVEVKWFATDAASAQQGTVKAFRESLLEITPQNAEEVQRMLFNRIEEAWKAREGIQ